MDAATFATGVSVQPPSERGSRKPFFPFARPPPASCAPAHGSPASRASLSAEIQQQTVAVGPTDADKGDEDETYGALQEVAYQYASERASVAVGAVIASANVNCYHQVLRFFERHRSHPPPAAPSLAPTLTPSLAPRSLPEFLPEFLPFPAAGVVSGADAASSDVWISPLCQVLQRSFPLVLVLPAEVPTARRLVEWLVEQLDAVESERAREEQWLVKEINAFDLWSAEPPDARVGGAMSLSAPNVRVTRRKRKELEEQWRRRQPERQARRTAVQTGGAGAGYSSGSAFDDDPSDSSSSDYSSDDSTAGRKRPVKRLRVGGAARSTRAKPLASHAARPYAKWTVDRMLDRVWSEVNALMSGSDPREAWMAVLRDMVLAPLKEMTNAAFVADADNAEEATPVRAVQCGDEAAADDVGEASGPPSARSSESIQKAVKGCQSAIRWLMGRVSDSRYAVVAGVSGSADAAHSSHPAPTSTAVKMRSTEFALAQLLHEVLRLSQRFAVSTMEKIKAATCSTVSPAVSADHEKPSGGSALAARLPELEAWRSTLIGSIKKYEAQYQLQHHQGPAIDAPKPFLLLCIEELEAFSSHVLDDFVEIWTHFRQIQRSFQQEAVSGALPASLSGFMSMGLIVGVASGASPALRRLPVALACRLDMQFFQLDDSLKCFDDILERLVVDQKLPLALSGAALRLLAERHRTTQSIGVFLHVLRYLLFSHFKHVPWSLLSHFAFATHCERPLDALGAISSLSPATATWLVRARRKEQLPVGRSRSPADLVTAYLDLFPENGARVAELHAILSRSPRGSGKKRQVKDADWKRSVARELQRLARRRARWTAGWQCFRSACSWLDVPLAGDALLTHLALALDGKLAAGDVIHRLVQRLERASAVELLPMVDHWRALVEGVVTAAPGEGDDVNPENERAKQVAETLRELVMLCEYAVEKQDEGTTKRMLVHVRGEIRDVLVDRLVVEFVQSPGSSSGARRSLGDLATLRVDQSVADRLRFSYHDKLKELLLATALEEQYESGGGGDGRAATWLEDVSVAFLYYQENPGVHLRLRDWLDAFADAVGQAAGPDARRRSAEERKEARVAVKARFLRAFCTLRHWGFVKSEATSDCDSVEKLVFI